jgi:hypothetical protein
MATDNDWHNTDLNMQYSLGPQSNPDGRREMHDGLLAASVAHMGDVKSGFHKTQDGGPRQGARDAFDACCVANETKVYNIGRRILGLPNV